MKNEERNLLKSWMKPVKLTFFSLPLSNVSLLFAFTESSLCAICVDAKREKIKDLLEFIQDRLNELEEEKEELKQYQVSFNRRSVED